MKKSVYLFIGFITAFTFSCDPNHSEGDEAKPSIDQSLMLSSMSENQIVPGFEDLNLKMLELVQANDAFVLNINQTNLDLFQAKLKATYLAWQQVSFLEFGPSDQVELKSNVNVFPTDVNQIENNILSGSANLDALSNKSAKGFPALDYLLHHKSDSLIQVNFDSNRSNYMNKVVDDLKTKINQVNSNWSSYKSTFENATGTDVGSSTGMLVNALNQHLERYFRDGKIGIPLGVRSSGVALPDNSESYYAGYSFELIKSNFQAMKELYTGGNSIGLDDYLIASDGADLDQIINTQISIIESKLSQFNTSMPDAIQNQNSELTETYQEIQKLIVYWKVDMPSRLGILITYQDNDGD